MDLNLLIPELYQVNKWNLSSFGDKEDGISVTYLYLREPEPTFNLDAMYRCFKNYLQSLGIDPASKVTVGGSLHKYDKKKEVLSLKTFKINPHFLDLRYNSNCRNVTAKRLTIRLKEKGFTLVFWTRACALNIFKNFVLEEKPYVFVRNFLRELEYPKFVIRDRLAKDTPQRFLWWYNGIVDQKKELFRRQL